MAAIPEAKATEYPPSRPPTISSSASQPGVPSSREYARRSPSTKFEAGVGGTFSGEPGPRSRPAETSQDSTDVGSLVLDKRIRQPDLDERLPSDAEPPGLLINLTQEVDWEIHVHPLDRAAGSDGLGEIHVRRQIGAGVVHGVQFGGRECSSLGGTLLVLHRVL